MKKAVKTTKDPLRERTGNKKKPSPKPWVREYQIIKGTDLNQWGFKGKEYDTWYPDYWYKYMSVEHALQQMNKDCRNFQDAPDWRIRGKEFRVINTDTDQIVYLQFNGKEMEIKNA
jgi:hypothetical protein